MDPSLQYYQFFFDDNVYYTIEVKAMAGKFGLTSKGLATLMQAITHLYELVAKKSKEAKLAYAQTECKRLEARLSPLKSDPVFSEFIFAIISDRGQLIAINPRFDYNFYDNVRKMMVPNRSFAWPEYVNSSVNGYLVVTEVNNRDRNVSVLIAETDSGIRKYSNKRCCAFIESEFAVNDTGLIRFTPEFNIDTKFDNANFYKAENDNFTEEISQFINAPSFNKALFIRPALRKCKHKHGHKKYIKYTGPVTTATDLQLMVASIYQIALAVQTEEITWENGSEQIIRQFENMNEYLVKGARSVFFLQMENNIYLQFINRYHLPKSDCVVAFTLNGVQDFTKDNRKDLILSVSEVPVDEDMSEAIYSPIVGIFAYGQF